MSRCFLLQRIFSLVPRREGLAGSRVFLVSACGVVFFGD